MSKVFKNEYKNCTVVVRTQFGRRVTIDTSTANPKEWANISEFSFLFEEEVSTPKIEVEETIEEEKELSALTLKELRERFPDIKDSSKAGFLKQLED